MTKIPFKLKGLIYGSAMPFSVFDKERKLISKYKKHRISAVVMLISDNECMMRENINLRKIYTDEGFEVIYFPIVNLSVPQRNNATDVILHIIEKVESGENVVIHCYAGHGRTGTIIAIIAKKLLNLQGRRAISWVRQYIPQAIESQEQIEFIVSF